MYLNFKKMDSTASSKTGTARAEVEAAPTAPSVDTAAAADLPDGVGLHDLISLGAIRDALLLSSGRLPASSAGDADEHNGKNKASGGTSKRLTDEEARRLPLLLRLLSASRPLSSRPAIGSTNNDEEAEDGGSAGTASKSSSEADQ